MYHQYMPLLMHSFTSRILAFIIDPMVQRSLIPIDELNVENVREAITKIGGCDDEGVEVVLSSAGKQYQDGILERGIRFLEDEPNATVIQMKIPK